MSMRWEYDMEPENTKPEAGQHIDHELQKEIDQDPDIDYAEGAGL